MDSSANNTQQNTNNQPVTQTIQPVIAESNVQSEPVVTPVQYASSKMQPPLATQNQGEDTAPRGVGSTVNSAPAQPVSKPFSKEHEPMPDIVKMTENQILQEENRVDKELKEIVAKSPDIEKPEISEEAKKAGLEHAKENTQMPVTASSNISLPMTYEQAQLTRKKYRFRDSIAWLADIIIYYFKQKNRKPDSEDRSGFG